MKVTIVYWSGTGNTERMAEAIAEGARAAGAETELLPVSGADASVTESDVLLFGCPAMGCETLEEGEFEPFFSAIEGALAGKKVGLFGSYDWGDGEWMRTWYARTQGRRSGNARRRSDRQQRARRRGSGKVQGFGRACRKGGRLTAYGGGKILSGPAGHGRDKMPSFGKQ